MSNEAQFEIKPASRSSLKPLIGLYGRSGGGKTLSALLVMRGLLGPKGRIVCIDSENRRASIFSDVVPGGYFTLDLDPPFSPERYWSAIQAAEPQADGIVIDSASHEWSGDGGVLDMQEAELARMAGDNWSKREACRMASFIKPKMAHKRLVEHMLRIRQPLIMCLRGEQKTHMGKDEKGKTQVTTDDFCTPIADPRLIFEFLIHAETYQKPNADGHMIGGYLRITKITHHDVIGLLPNPGQQIGVAHGEALARWCAGGATAPAPAPIPPPPPKPAAQATEEQRGKLIKALAQQEQLAVEYFQKVSQLLPTEGLADLPLRFVPATKKQFDALSAALTDFGNGADAKAAFPPNGEP
jgi:hypothetical protein